MTGFSADWLRLREPHDAAARAARPVENISARPAAGTRTTPFQVVDLGAGTGANLRFLAPRIGGSQDWLLIERDPGLIGVMDGCFRAWADSVGARITSGRNRWTVRSTQFECRVQCVPMDLAAGLDRLSFPDGALVTASALLDLVSEPWLTALAKRCAAARTMVWFALTYDGRIDCTPAEPEDQRACELFNRHQLRDKGFGPALGAGAARKAVEIFENSGYFMSSRQSDWHIGPAEAAMQRALLEGWFEAACEVAPAGLQPWREKRHRHISDAVSRMIVGHVDLMGRLPSETASRPDAV